LPFHVPFPHSPISRTPRRAAGRPVVGPALLAAGLIVLAAAPAEAYIGPGAGFALVSSLGVILWTVFLAFLALLNWPIRWAIRSVRGRQAFARSRIRRLVILGLDGMEPSLAEKLMSEGKLPNLSRLRQMGCYKLLGTTTPPLSPVAWSSFLTGVNPGKHNIYDFLNADRRTYLPNLSSVSIHAPTRSVRLGRYTLPLNKPEIRLLRKGKPFWNTLGEHGIFSSVVRVPITFPPERCRGVVLSAMCVPDLRGTQGLFAYYSTANGAGQERTGGEQVRVVREGGRIRAALLGPENSLDPSAGQTRVPFEVRLNGTAGHATLEIAGGRYELRQGAYTDWIRVPFRMGPGMSATGICRFLLLRTEPEFELYVTPINIDPEKPALPISFPQAYSTYLARRFGSYATLGLAEDTWALNEELIDDDAFLEQCVSIDAERERQFFDALRNTPQGLCVCVFDGTDRIQHMFWRYIDETHPAHPARRPAGTAERHFRTIEEHYLRMDDLVGRTMKEVLNGDGRSMLMVISDHGFSPFRRGIDLNAWLVQEGYLRLKPDAPVGAKYLSGVDWSQSRAYALGLAGIFINQEGREAQGVVPPGEETRRLKLELIRRLARLTDPQTGEVAITRVQDRDDAYTGPFRETAPDLIVGYNRGYRVAWDTAIGTVTESVFHDNNKAWSGDHCIDPELIPGVLFCSHRVLTEAPRLMDLGPTALDLFGVPVPRNMDGRPLEVVTSP
jgi:predicted AlkP superfamily phosphohydrolase/phosphomutase